MLNCVYDNDGSQSCTRLPRKEDLYTLVSRPNPKYWVGAGGQRLACKGLFYPVGYLAKRKCLRGSQTPLLHRTEKNRARRRARRAFPLTAQLSGRVLSNARVAGEDQLRSDVRLWRVTNGKTASLVWWQVPGLGVGRDRAPQAEEPRADETSMAPARRCSSNSWGLGGRPFLIHQQGNRNAR